MAVTAPARPDLLSLGVRETSLGVCNMLSVCNMLILSVFGQKIFIIFVINMGGRLHPNLRRVSSDNRTPEDNHSDKVAQEEYVYAQDYESDGKFLLF